MDKAHVLDSIKQTLTTHMPEGGKAYLYGSRARGDNRPDSDWDVLLLLDSHDDDDRTGASYSLFELGWTLDEDIIPVVYAKDEWERFSFTPFYHNVNNDGILIYGS